MNQDDESHGESEGHTTMSASSAPGVGNGSGNVISSSSNGNSSSNSVLSSIMGSRVLPPRGQGGFSLSTEDDCRSNSRDPVGFKLQLHRGAETWAVQHSSFQSSTTSLNPNRPPEVLTLEIYDLICTQMRFIVGLAHKDLIQRTMEAIIDTAQKSSSSSSSSSSAPLDFGEILWGRGSATSGESGRIYNTLLSTLGESSDGERRRGRSPARGGRASSREGRKQLHSLSKGRANSANNNNNNNNSSSGNMSTTAVNNSSSAGIAADAESDFTSGDASSAIGASADSDVETPRGTAAGVGGGNRPPLTAERRSRSQSSGHRATSAGRPSLAVAGAGAAAKAAAKKHAAQSSMDDQGVRYQQRGGSVGAPHRFHSTALGRQIAVLKSVPPEVRHRISSSVGPVSGVWLHLHPLQLQSLQHEEILHLVGENPTLPPNKRIEWELDIMREYDEKRMEKFAAFLISRRNAAMDAQFDTRKISQQFKQGAAAGVSNSNSKSSGTGRASMVKASGALAYYRDRGRQPGK